MPAVLGSPSLLLPPEHPLAPLGAQHDSSLLPANIPVQHPIYHNASIYKTQKLPATRTKMRRTILQMLAWHFVASETLFTYLLFNTPPLTPPLPVATLELKHHLRFAGARLRKYSLIRAGSGALSPSQCCQLGMFHEH